MKHVFVVGLGLMGASYAEAMSQKGLIVSGYDINPSVSDQAIKDGVIRDADLRSMTKADVVILALYPKQNIEFVQKNHHLFVENQLVTDISGTKTHVIKAIDHYLDAKVSYMSHHPMAGRALIGYAHRDKDMFMGNKCILVHTPRSNQKDEETLKKLAHLLGFKDIITVDAQTHDQLIGYTSQLTHLLAVALMHVETPEVTKHATGDSFRDLTRIANINAEMWSELFLDNKESLLKTMDDMMNQMNRLKEIIQSSNRESLILYLQKAKEKRVSYDKN